MKKIVKKTGNSLGIIFNKEECDVYKIREGDILDLELKEVIRCGKTKK